MGSNYSLQKIYEKPSKRMPLVIKWGEQSIYFGLIEFLGDGSLIFKTDSHSSKNANLIVELGASHLANGEFANLPADKLQTIGKGLHISLHPPTQSQPGVMHFRENAPGRVLSQRHLEWFPVTQPFKLLHLFTLPLDMYPSTAKDVTIKNTMDPSYRDSLEIILDIFPRDTKTAHPFLNSFEVWGHCPFYLVRISILQARSRTPEIIYWPDDDRLEL